MPTIDEREITVPAPARTLGTADPPSTGFSSWCARRTRHTLPGWQIALIAFGAALVAAVTAVLLDRARLARRHVTATASRPGTAQPAR